MALTKQGSEERGELWIPAPEQQAKWLVEEWNIRPEFAGVYDILWSGGEPMMFPNSIWANILRVMEGAKHLKCFRICTGALFLGLPFRFDDEFINMLVDFRNRTGVQVKLAVHVSHPEHVTPEAGHFARKLLDAGIELLTQTPLEPGVNFWMHDLERTEDVLRNLGRALAMKVGVRPYKWILDMQGGVSLLPAIEVWRRLHDRHQGESDITRSTSFALFSPKPEGNLNLSYHSLWAIQMRVDKEAGKVHYRIPHPAGTWVDYQEHLWEGVNDNPQFLEGLRLR